MDKRKRFQTYRDTQNWRQYQDELNDAFLNTIRTAAAVLIIGVIVAVLIVI